ncbi:hypothetical protein [Streptomyces rubiginosohelvolus]|uniref:hypothetical protein n=1 Tax=Streptomyces rubiginosohelvolus TaxID=67362 RepID=UPI0035DCD4A4
MARTASAVGHRPLLRGAIDELTRAAAESAGSGSGLFSYGPVTDHLAAAAAALDEA